MTCRVNCSFLGTIHWEYGGEEISNNDLSSRFFRRVSVMSGEISLGVEMMRVCGTNILIESITYRDSGQYVCHQTDHNGQDESSGHIQLDLQGIITEASPYTLRLPHLPAHIYMNR